MTISGQRFIDETTNSPLSQLVTGTNNPPKSTEIPKQETKEVYDKALSDYVKERQSAKGNIEALQPTKSEIPDNRIKPSFIKEPSTATISPADWFQTSQIKAEMESPQKSTDVITETIGGAKETALSLQTARDTANTSTLSEQRDIARPQFERMRVQTLSFAKPILDKDQDTQGLIETAKTGKTNIFENAYRNNVEYGVGSSINTIFPDQWVDISEDTVYFTNSQATVKKPTLKNTLNFQNSKIEDAYNSITYNFAHNGDMYSVEQVKEFYKEWKNVPDDVIQQFIYDCCYDVQNGKRRNIDKYAEFYPALSNADGYVNQKDSLLQLLTDENFVSWGLGEYLTIDGEDGKDATKFLGTQKGGEDLTELLVAANTIAGFADMLNEAGANISQATDYAIVKSYADMYPELQKAIDTFDSYELTNAEFQKIVDTYNSNIYKIKKQFEYFGGEKGLSKAEYDKKVDDLVQENLRQINEEFMNSFKKEVLQSGGANFITDFYRGNSYLADNGKWYNKKGEEIKKNDVTIGLANKYLETFRSFSHHMSELDYDWQFATQDPSRESIVNVLSDDVSLLFDVFMMGEGGLKFQAKTGIPIVGSIYESLLEGAMEVSGESILQLANMTLFVDGEWSAESQQKFKEAAGGLVFMQIMKEIEKAKGPIKAELKRDFNRSAFTKSLRVFIDKLAEGIKTIDILAEKAKIQQKNQPEVEKGDNEKAINKIEQETKVQKIILVRNIFQEALKAFNTVFEGELTMNAEDGRKPTLIDTLWNAATNIRRGGKGKSVDEILEERVQGSENDILRNERSIKEKEDRISELEKKPELTPEEIAEIDRLRGEIENLKAENDTITKRTENVKSFQTEGYHDKQVEIENRKVELENRETERDNLSQRLKDIDNEIINAKAEGDTKLVEELRAEKKDTKQQIKNIEQEISSMQRTIREMEGTASMRDILENMKEGAQETIQETREGFRQWGEEIATPEIEVEQTSTGTPEKIEGAEKVKGETPEETRSTITRILDIIQQFKNISSELYKKITQPKEDVEKDIKESELNRQARDEIFKQEKLSKKTREVMENSIWTDSILRIVNDFVSEQTNRKGEVTDVDLEKPRPSNDEIQRDVLSDGLTSIQSYVNRIKQLGKKIGELYDHLSKQPTIRVRDFINSKDFQSLLSENNLKLVEYRNGRGIYKREIVSEDGSRLSPEQQEIQKYMEDMVNDMLTTPWISEYDAHQIRRSFLKKKERKDNEYVSGVKKQLYNRFNNFLENTGQGKLLRKIDEGYAELSDSLEVMSELLGKDSELKNNAKNQILKWNEDKLNQIEEILPGFKSLVELTRYAPEIVNATINAKMQYKQTRVWLGNWIRYAGVMIASKIGGFGGFLLGSLGFTSIERIGNNLKKKAIKTKLDWDLYNNFVDALKVEGNEKAKYKQGELKRIEELNKIKEGETDKRFQEIVDDAMQILIDKQAQQIIAEKQAKAEAEQRRIESENRRRQTEWNQAQQPIDNALPGVKPDVISPEGDITLGRGNVISPDKGPGRPKPLKESKPLTKVTEINKYNEAEQMIVDASLGKTEEKTYSPEAEKVASILEEQLNATTKIIEEDATNRVIEKGEELTDENIQKEMQREPSSIEEFIMEAEKGAPEESTNYDGADIKDLEDVVANPKKYPGVDIEAAKSALDKARKQNMKASVMQSPDQIKAQTEKAGVYKADQMEKEHNSGWEGQKEKTVRDTNRDPDALETTEEYDRIDKQLTPESGELATKYSKGYKGFYRSDKDQADKLRADMGKKPSQNITYTSSVDKIATLTNPKTRARVAQERLNKKKRLSEEEKAQLNQIIDQANVEIQAKEELKAQKTELANEYKALDEKREKTLSTEKRKEITKQMDKISDEFDKLTYEEQGQFAKPKEVEAEEIKEAERIEEERQNLDMNETPQKAEPEIKKQETKKESEGERSFGDEEYTKRDDKIEEMSKDESITIKDTINEIEEIVGGGIKDYQEKIYGEKRDKEESYTNDGAESFRNKVNDKIRERDKKFWEDQRSKTKDMESTKLTKEQEKQLEEAKTKEEKDALMNKWRKEYIERNPIAEEYLKEAEEHNKQFQKAMDALGKIDAIVRRIRRKRREDIDKRWEETKRKLREKEKKEIDLLDQNETPQIDEIPQEVSSKKTPESSGETQVEELFGRQPKQEKTDKVVTREKTSSYEWKGKQNMEEFEKKFENDPEDRYTDGVDEYGEVVGQPKEVKLRNFVQKTFGKVDRSSSAFRDSQYDEQVAMATEIVDTNISYKDITLRYYKDTGEMKSDKGTSETAKAYFDRDNVQLGVGDPNYKYSPLHEVHHGLDYKFAKELGFDGEIGLSRIVTEEGFKAEGKYKDLIQRFQNLMQDIMRKQSKIKDDKILSPDETFARFGEAFGQWTKGEKVETSAKDYFDRDTNLFQRYVDWLSDMADAREKGVLEKGDLNPISEGEISEYRNLKVQEPPKELRDEIDSWCEITGIIGKNYLEKVKRLDSYIRKGIDMEDLTEIEKGIYKTIKEKYIPYQLDTLGEKVLDLGSATSNTKNKKTKGTFVPLEEGNVVAYPHLGGEAYNNLKNQGYIISKNEFYNKDKEK